MNHDDTYSEWNREVNLSLLGDLTNARDEQSFVASCGDFRSQFHPSFFAELDWQDLRGDAPVPGQLANLGANLSFMTLEENILIRKDQLDLSDDVAAEVATQFAAFQQDQRTASSSDPASSAQELVTSITRTLEGQVTNFLTNRFASAAQLLEQHLSSVKDESRIVHVIQVSLSNWLAVLLDQPLTRDIARAFAYRWRVSNGTYPPTILGSPTLTELRVWLEEAAAAAEASAVPSWASLARKAAQILSTMDEAALREFEGQRSNGFGNCARCSMHFASEALISIDSTCNFVKSFDDRIIYLPPGLNFVICPFCGEGAYMNTPAMFHSFERRQVIYCLPRRPGLTDDQAISLYGPIIAEIREEYLRRIPPESAQAFNDAAELIARSWDEFVYAIQMGETVWEDHVLNFVTLADGSGLLIDFTKGFVRGLTGAELEVYLRGARGIVTGSLEDEDLERSRTDLEIMLREDPDNEDVRLNLTMISRILDYQSAYKRPASRFTESSDE